MSTFFFSWNLHDDKRWNTQIWTVNTGALPQSRYTNGFILSNGVLNVVLARKTHMEQADVSSWWYLKCDMHCVTKSNSERVMHLSIADWTACGPISKATYQHVHHHIQTLHYYDSHFISLMFRISCYNHKNKNETKTKTNKIKQSCWVKCLKFVVNGLNRHFN